MTRDETVKIAATITGPYLESGREPRLARSRRDRLDRPGDPRHPSGPADRFEKAGGETQGAPAERP